MSDALAEWIAEVEAAAQAAYDRVPAWQRNPARPTPVGTAVVAFLAP